MVAEKTYKELILEGEKIREKGNPLGAIPIFILAHAKANKPSQISNALRHIGLCYEHLNELDKAAANYSDSLKIASMTENIGDIARTKRHLLSVELKKGNYEKAYRLGTEARKQMKIFSFPPSDLVWITHGVVKVLIEKKAPKKEVREWVRIEHEDLKWAMSLEKKPYSKTCVVDGLVDGCCLCLGSLVVATHCGCFRNLFVFGIGFASKADFTWKAVRA